MLELSGLENPIAALLTFVAGAALLVAGRKIFWLLVAAAGFAFGFLIAQQILDSPDGSATFWLLGLVGGAVGVLLALVLQRLAIGLVGFWVGGTFAAFLAGTEPGALTGTSLLVFLVGGILGSILAIWLFDAALIVLSSLVGANLVVQAAMLYEPDLTATTRGWAILLLAVLGIAIQSGFRRRRRPAAARGEEG